MRPCIGGGLIERVGGVSEAHLCQEELGLRDRGRTREAAGTREG